MSRRKRSALTEADCLEVFRAIAKRTRRFGETSDPSIFTEDGSEPMRADELNVQLCVAGSFGSNDDFFEAIRVLAGHKLPRKEVR